MRTIEIGLEIHKAIEAERRSLEETENTILMRLLDLSPAIHEAPRKVAAMGTGAAWRKDGVELPHGTRLRASYSGQELEGVVQDGIWHVAGSTYKSPSMALIHNVTTRSGHKTNLNGWNHWLVQRPGDPSFIRLLSLRR
jgi:hypothetical protein